MKEIAVSVIMPVYNAQKYIGRAIESVLNQDFESFELILVDDGSSDGSGIICDDYAHKDSRIVLIRQKNAGTCAARNVALDVARGKYITFCDHDDEYLPHLLRDNFELIEHEKADVLQFSINRIYTERNNQIIEQCLKNDVVLAKDLRQRYLDVRLCENFADVWNHFYRRDLINELRFNTIFDHGKEDVYFNLNILLRVKGKLIFNSRVYYNHYLYPTSSGTISKLKLTDDIVAQFKTLFDAEYVLLTKFLDVGSYDEYRAANILNDSLQFVNYRAKMSSREDFAKLLDVKLFFEYPYKLKLKDRLCLWSLKSNHTLYLFFQKIGLECGSTNYQKTALNIFFENLFHSPKGRWLFDLCNFGVKVITLPFRLFK